MSREFGDVLSRSLFRSESVPVSESVRVSDSVPMTPKAYRTSQWSQGWRTAMLRHGESCPAYSSYPRADRALGIHALRQIQSDSTRSPPQLPPQFTVTPFDLRKQWPKRINEFENIGSWAKAAPSSTLGAGLTAHKIFYVHCRVSLVGPAITSPFEIPGHRRPRHCRLPKLLPIGSRVASE